MKLNKYLVIIFFFPVLFLSCGPPRNTVGLLLNTDDALDGYTLFTVHTETYLINNKGEVVKQWSSKYTSGKSVYLLKNGNLLRAAQISDPDEFLIPSIGGRVELFDWDGNLIWFYDYATKKASQHHDIFPMPNGNVLMLAVTVLSRDEAVEMGRKLLTPPRFQLYNEQILELKPKGKNDADIVWEWNVRDHLIQDYDETKDNYGHVGSNPQRLDINFPGTSTGASWLHLNSLQYNVDLDQIIMSSKHLSEIYIIDHSTTTAEAATGSGGRYNKGGDFLYRWGNPWAYRQGTVKDKKLFGPHYPHWIAEGLKDAGKIMVFNNGANRTPDYSEIFILTPPVSGPGEYIYSPNSAYGPKEPDYIYAAPVKTDFYSPFQSSAQRLPNGNILICEGKQGRFFEIDPDENIVWEYINPVGASGILKQGDDPASTSNSVFRIKKYPADYPAFTNRDLTPGAPIEKPRQ